MAVIPIFRAGKVGFRMLKSLYKGGGWAKKKTINLASKATNPTFKKGLEGAGKKLVSTGKHLRKYHKPYAGMAGGAALWDFLDND